MTSLLSAGEAINLTVQRAILGCDALAPEFAEADLSPVFKPDGTFDPSDEDYKALAKANFGGFKLTVDGLVNRPSALTLKDIRDLPSRTQITRHDCVEGWSAIGKWKGVPLAVVLDRAGMMPDARYVVLHCFDTMEQGLSGLVRLYSVSSADHPRQRPEHRGVSVRAHRYERDRLSAHICRLGAGVTLRLWSRQDSLSPAATRAAPRGALSQMFGVQRQAPRTVMRLTKPAW